MSTFRFIVKLTMSTRESVALPNDLRKLWRQSPLLLASAALMLAAFVAFLAGLASDPRLITGAPAWLKPAKFAISSAIYLTTLAWLASYIQVWPRWVRWANRAIAVAIVLEVAIIAAQAWRGQASHFNVGTPLDAALFSVMGAMIAVLLIASIVVLVALWRTPFQDASWGWALRLGMLISVLGSASGGLMLAPTPEQQAALEAGTDRPLAIGAHTVGAADGGPSLPGLGWSARKGDLRIPHFVGMHAIQVLPFLAWLVGRKRNGAVFSLSASYLGLVLLLAWQAFRGQSVVAPDDLTLGVAAAWLALSAAALGLTSMKRLPSAAGVAASGSR